MNEIKRSGSQTYSRQLYPHKKRGFTEPFSVLPKEIILEIFSFLLTHETRPKVINHIYYTLIEKKNCYGLDKINTIGNIYRIFLGLKKDFISDFVADYFSNNPLTKFQLNELIQFLAKNPEIKINNFLRYSAQYAPQKSITDAFFSVVKKKVFNLDQIDISGFKRMDELLKKKEEVMMRMWKIYFKYTPNSEHLSKELYELSILINDLIKNCPIALFELFKQRPKNVVAILLRLYAHIINNHQTENSKNWKKDESFVSILDCWLCLYFNTDLDDTLEFFHTTPQDTTLFYEKALPYFLNYPDKFSLYSWKELVIISFEILGMNRSKYKEVEKLFQLSPEELKNDLEYIRSLSVICECLFISEHLISKEKNTTNSLVEIPSKIFIRPKNLSFLDRDSIKKIITIDPCSILELSRNQIIDDKELALIALNTKQLSSKNLGMEVIEKIVSCHPKDDEIMKLIVINNERGLRFTPIHYRKNINFVLAAVKIDPDNILDSLIKYNDLKTWQQSQYIIYEALKQKEFHFDYILSLALPNEVIVEAKKIFYSKPSVSLSASIEGTPSILRCCSDEVLKDKQSVIFAIYRDATIIEKMFYFSDDLEIMSILSFQNKNNIKYASERIQKDLSFLKMIETKK